MREFLQKVLQYHITDGKPGSREIHGPITNDVDEIVVSAAAGQRTVLALAIENLENQTVIIIKAADDRKIQFYHFCHSSPSQLLRESLEARDSLRWALQKGLHLIPGDVAIRQFSRGSTPFFPHYLINDRNQHR